jgi:hypothetical protein
VTAGPIREHEREAVRSARRAQVLLALARSPLFLTAAQAQAVLADAGCDTRRRLRELAGHLAVTLDALTSGDSDCPVEVVRLTETLIEHGHPAIRPCCSVCGDGVRPLPRTGPDGRMCRPCAVRASMRPCSKCTKTAIIVRKGPDGSGLCLQCAPNPDYLCRACGTMAPAATVDPDGTAVCHPCYRQTRQPQRVCGNCGKVRPIAVRGRDGSPDLCSGCHRGHEQVCEICGVSAICRGQRSGTWRCRACTPRPEQTCAHCGRSRPINANWPIGPVCMACYNKILNHPARCPVCESDQPLIAAGPDGTRCCGPCAGHPGLDYACKACGRTGRPWSTGRCAHCVLTERITTVLTGPDGQIIDQLHALSAAMAKAPNPIVILNWLQRSPNVALLSQLAASGRALTHQMLDELPANRHENFLRHLLIAHGALEPRDDGIERIGSWLEDHLATRPAHHARLMRPFVHWFLLPRARRRAGQRKHEAEAGPYLRARTLTALRLIDFLDAHQMTLAELRQPMLDQWLLDGGKPAHEVRYFLDWAGRHGQAETLTVPKPTARTTAPLIDEDDRWQLLHRCVTNSDLPLDARAAGSLILLFGLTATRIRHLKADQLQIDDGHTYLTTGHHPLPIPPRIAELLHQQARSPQTRPFLPGCHDPGPWMFPGQIPGRPLSANGMTKKLEQIGIAKGAARLTALMALATTIPASILADVLGLSYTTTVKWANISHGDWSTYLAARTSELANEGDHAS